VRAARPGGLGAAVGTRMHDAQNGDEEQDGEGHVRADEGRGEDRGQDGKGRGGGMGQRGEEGDERSGESRAHEGGEAARPDAGAGLRVSHAAPPAARLFVPPMVPRVSVVCPGPFLHCRSYLPCCVTFVITASLYIVTRMVWRGKRRKVYG